MITFKDVVSAEKRISGTIIKTPIVYSHFFSKISSNEIYFKLENLQRTGSFKIRGALNKIKYLKQHRKAVVVAASAGNHAQGVALSASIAGLKSIIVMPKNATKEKISATKDYGGEVILYGDNLSESITKAKEIASANNYEFISPYDDPFIIAGQGTIGLELLNHDFDYVFVPVGGGGLIGGIALALKEKSNTKVIGIECKPFDSMFRSLKLNKIIEAKPRKVVADGIAVPKIGEIAFELAKKYVDGVYVVNESLFEKAIFLLLQRSKLVVEGAGAAGVAFLLSKEFKKLDIKNRRICILLSGGNISSDKLVAVVSKYSKAR